MSFTRSRSSSQQISMEDNKQLEQNEQVAFPSRDELDTHIHNKVIEVIDLQDKNKIDHLCISLKLYIDSIVQQQFSAIAGEMSETNIKNIIHERVDKKMYEKGNDLGKRSSSQLIKRSD